MIEKIVTEFPQNPRCDGTYEDYGGRPSARRMYDVHCNGGMSLIDSKTENGNETQIYKCRRLVCGETTTYIIVKE